MRSLPSSTISGIADLVGAGVLLIGCALAVWARIVTPVEAAPAALIAIRGLTAGPIKIVLPQRASTPAGGSAGITGDHP